MHDPVVYVQITTVMSVDDLGVDPMNQLLDNLDDIQQCLCVESVIRQVVQLDHVDTQELASPL
jgi:hypothetical protein